MRIAILVLAYRAPAVLKAVVSAYRSPDVTFFVHVDSKGDDAEFAFLAFANNVNAAVQRFDIFWGGFSMVRAEIALLRSALAHGFDRYLLISDDAFPLVPVPALQSLLADGLNSVGVPAAENTEPLDRYRDFFHYDSRATTPRPEIRQPGRFLPSESRDLIDLAELMQRGKKKLAVLFHGSQWWVLTAEAARHVVQIHESDPHLRDSFRFSAVPDESYIQTIVGTAFPDRVGGRRMMWSDFSREPKPFVFRTPESLDRAFASGMPFVRKIAAEHDLLDVLLARLRS